MTTNTKAINFLKKAKSDINAFHSMTREFEAFTQGDYLDNIQIVINGIDQTLFASTSENHLISEACQRLKTPVFGNRLAIHACDKELDVLWFPPAPIRINDYKREEKIIRKNVTQYFYNELGLSVSEVSISFLTDGTGWEEFFYERYFLPKKFMEITGIAEHSQQSSIPNDDKTIMSYILEGNAELLKSLVREQLSEPLGFDLQLAEPFHPSDSTVLFMPFFRVCINVPPNKTATEIISRVNSKFQVLDCSEMNDCLTLLCMAHEGPYAETISDIIINIHELLSPHVMQFFNTIGLEPISVSFILTDTEH